MRQIMLFAVAVLAAAVTVASAGARTKGASLSLVAYSTPKTVLAKIISAWQQTPEGKGVSFTTSYGPSGDQAKAVAAGLKADLVFLSTGDDVNTLVDAGLVDKNWQQASFGGNVASSVVAFAFRGGNPKHIKTWDDLVKPGVQIVTPNPFSSGSAKWNVLAAYAAARREGKTDKQAQALVEKLFRNVVSQDSSGRNATNTFLTGKGDVLLTYESEAVAAEQAGQSLGYLVPSKTMLIQLPMVPIKSSSNLALANRFIAFVKSAPAQALLAQAGYRPVLKSVAKQYRSSFPTRALTTIDNPWFGGWRKVDKRWFDPQHGLMVGIEKAVGGPTG
ncbi:MAG TPA: sulfate ABC transporter substrate-binding protein [Gaiellaceae bacterium]|nr:sulfate ABC transporter substrate-binding protein [Gaiellaceae bacterium]